MRENVKLHYSVIDLFKSVSMREPGGGTAQIIEFFSALAQMLGIGE